MTNQGTLSKFLLCGYCVFYSLLPLTCVHGKGELFIARIAHSTVLDRGNLHLFFHEYFFAHFGDKTEHLHKAPLKKEFFSAAKRKQLKHHHVAMEIYPLAGNAPQKFIPGVLKVIHIAVSPYRLSGLSPPFPSLSPQA